MINRLRSWTRAFFGISTREANGLMILLPLLLTSVFIIPAYQQWQSKQPTDFSSHHRKLDSLLAQWPQQTDSVIVSKKITRFTFNPNTASLSDFDSLGFPEVLAQRIQNYRAKNGKFKIKSDLLRIYGMDTTFYNSLEAFIQLPERTEPNNSYQKTQPTVLEIKEPLRERFDLNTADSAQLIKIYGIGAKLSTRIINYRNKLGGFISIDQLKEVYGLDSAVINRIQAKYNINPNYQPRKLMLNQASEKELSNHPYISYALAKAITTYRFQHGNFNSLEDVKKIALVDEALFNKIVPYLSLNP
ncbi:MAG: helix-hairpin-helix domain-containing protein [Cyclobacteriaceae bacterium]|nr:helix-hairpin-helix domain-containing protein [Cyclobacteriaceae bacterium]